MSEALQTYKYVGPCNSSFTLPPESETAQPRDVMLWRNKEVDLPPENDYVKSLIAQGYLKLVSKPPTPAKSSKKPALPESEG